MDKEIEASFHQQIEAFRQCRTRLIDYKAQVFPREQPVQVNCARYQGTAIVILDAECPPDMLAVGLPNGNHHWYPLEACTPANWPDPEPPVSAGTALLKFGAPPARLLTRPIISVDRRTGMLGIFDEFDLIWGFRAFEDEAHAVEMAKLWLKSFCNLDPEVVHPNVTKMKVN